MLLFAVRFEVVFGSVLGVLRGVKMVSMGNVGVVCGGFVVAVGVMPSGFVVMACSVLVMLRCLGVILGCLTGHGLAPFIRFALG